MANNESTNKSGDTKTTSREYVKRESGEQNVPAVPARNPGHTSPNDDDLENPQQDAQRPHRSDDAVADKIKKTNRK